MRLTLLAVACLTLLCTLSNACEAQNSCTISVHVCVYSAGQNGGLVDVPMVSPSSACSSSGPFCSDCNVKTNACPPLNSPPEICLSCLLALAGNPIHLATGNTFIAQSDITVPGLGGGLTLTRTWNSLLPAIQNVYSPMFGAGWRSNYEERLMFNAPDGYIKWARGEGSVWSFGVSSFGDAPSTTYLPAAPANDTTQVVNSLDPTTGARLWTLIAKNGEKRTFDPNTGALLSIIDRNGNTTQLTYDSSNRLVTVTDPASRHLYFNYNGSSTLVNTVTTDIGITLSYAYDGQGRLTQVTKPDNTTISFGYDSGSHITTVTDSNGKLLESHSYDALGRGLTSSRANGVDAVTVTYPD
jgi:YD repeat-containing protein